jgi:hypothetical protein
MSYFADNENKKKENMTTENMTDFFSKERRIEENRQRLRELFEQFKKTENYYPLFLAYLTAFAIYFFDFIALLFQPFFPCYFMSLTLLTGLSFAYVLYLIWKFFDSVNWNFDYLPFGVYTEFPKEINPFCSSLDPI